MNRPQLSLLVTAACFWRSPFVPTTPNRPRLRQAKITPQTRMLLIRDLTAEHCFARRSFPIGHKGLVIRNRVVTPNDAQVAQLIAENGPSRNPVTRLLIPRRRRRG